ncbi:MAG TPA: PIN domain-containing protein [Bryobacteraceae bacterium]|nr:PIN domain-containing protein [Bryobacteraceae bacterium]
MPDRAFFDTNVLIYAIVENDARNVRARELLATGGIISVQVLNEFVSTVRRKVQMPWKDVKAALQWLQILCPDPIPLTVETHDEAITIAEQYGYKIYDSLILASALAAKCAVLYSEDLQDGQLIDPKLTIRNPFR